MVNSDSMPLVLGFCSQKRKKQRSGVREYKSIYIAPINGVEWGHVVKSGGLEMFIGEYRHNIDEKGRLALPAKFRGKLADGVIVTKGLESSLVIYTVAEWGKIAPKLSELPYTQSNARAFSRLILSGANDCQLDRQGRINLPAHLRDYAKLKTNTVIVGVYSRIEVWDVKEWEAYKEKVENQSEEIAENLENLGL